MALLERGASQRYFFGGDHLCFGVSIAVRVLRLVEGVAVGVLRASFPHDVQVAVGCGGELPGLSVEFHVAGTSERTVLADLFMITNELYLPTLRSFGAALGE
ncbi:hypothetical protein [Streptomyces sp. NPDC058695]|uniref:hypothetical protein n=1 Tax=Streptomyces sp. NPDC058695 TaxID=3346604 RepID=UPI003650B750